MLFAPLAKHIMSMLEQAMSRGSRQTDPWQSPGPQPFWQLPQLSWSVVRSTQTPLQHWGTGALHAVPTWTDVTHAPPTHAVLVHGSDAGQSDAVLHGGTHAPWPSHTPAPPLDAHAVPAVFASVPQQASAHVATMQGEEGGGQSLGWPHVVQLATVSPTPGSTCHLARSRTRWTMKRSSTIRRRTIRWEKGSRRRWSRV